MLASKQDCLMAISKAHTDPDAEKLLELLVEDHFAMIEHMKKTSLWDVYQYEEQFAKNSLEPMRILAYDNERLKKEINKMRRKLGLIEKYKENI